LWPLYQDPADIYVHVYLVLRLCVLCALRPEANNSSSGSALLAVKMLVWSCVGTVVVCLIHISIVRGSFLDPSHTHVTDEHSFDDPCPPETMCQTICTWGLCKYFVRSGSVWNTPAPPSPTCWNLIETQLPNTPTGHTDPQGHHHYKNTVENTQPQKNMLKTLWVILFSRNGAENEKHSKSIVFLFWGPVPPHRAVGDLVHYKTWWALHSQSERLESISFQSAADVSQF
jgi:hypothetical protein